MANNDIFTAPCDECGVAIDTNAAEVERLETLGELRHCEKCVDGEFWHDTDCFYEYGRVADPDLCTCEWTRPVCGCPGLIGRDDPAKLREYLVNSIQMSIARADDARKATGTAEGSAAVSAAELAEAWALATELACIAHRLAGTITAHDRRVRHTPRTPNPFNRRVAAL